jgi:Alw26I/Eco31I/Esp3I family type II restriction m6 adenine DNA methyltransferase
LICWLIESAHNEGVDVLWKISLWDHSQSALNEAEEQIMALQNRIKAKIELSIICTNSFEFAYNNEDKFDIVITNPPWETLKPDRRELKLLSPTDRDIYVGRMKHFDQQLAKTQPHSQPIKKFAGWGTNLSRVGLELSIKLLRHGGQIAIVLPSSTFADQMSILLREWVSKNITISSVGHFPAEARLFEHVDQSAMALTGTRKYTAIQRYSLHSLKPSSLDYNTQLFELSQEMWRSSGFCIPFSIKGDAQAFIKSISTFLTWAELENSNCGFWSGRELDETGINTKLSTTGNYSFIKGRMVGRFQLVELPTQKISIKSLRIPRSADMYRIAWRDVSRTTQRRRMQATMVDPGYVTGNSLNIALFENQNKQIALALLAVVNSLVFEVQVRSRSETSHISLGVVRGVRIPDIQNHNIAERLGALSRLCINNPGQHEADLEVAVAKEYGLTKKTFESLLQSFPKIDHQEVKSLLNNTNW